MTGHGRTSDLGVLSDAEVAAIVAEALAGWDLTGRRVLVLVPDATRTAPVPQLFRLLCAGLVGRAAALTVLVALGTHRAMPAAGLDRLVGAGSAEREAMFPGVRLLNHEWWLPATFAHLGRIDAAEVAGISGGLLAEAVDVRVNRLVLEHDAVVVCGPVFPHEVVGFSGGDKYFFPGIGGAEVIGQSHWLGALLTSRAIIGTPGPNPVRRLVERAAALVPRPRLCLAMVVATGTEPGAPRGRLHGLYAGTTGRAWAAAAELSAQVHVRYLDRPYDTVLSVMPPGYEDVWTAAKGMYKVEPVVADGGEVVILAPHVSEFSHTHGAELAEVGYHVRDYFLGQWDRFRDRSRAVLAHSTHLRGAGTWEPVSGEHPRVRVSLATGIDAARCAAHAVGHRDPAAVDPVAWARRDGVLVVPRAGETLYRLATERPVPASPALDRPVAGRPAAAAPSPTGPPPDPDVPPHP
ncbi:MAG: lactate racemase domain-containing protein [Kineosporiaceae bacterium]